MAIHDDIVEIEHSKTCSESVIIDTHIHNCRKWYSTITKIIKTEKYNSQLFVSIIAVTVEEPAWGDNQIVNIK